MGAYLQEQDINLVNRTAHLDDGRIGDFDGPRVRVDLLIGFDVQGDYDAVEGGAQRSAFQVGYGGFERGSGRNQLGLAEFYLQPVNGVVVFQGRLGFGEGLTG